MPVGRLKSFRHVRRKLKELGINWTPSRGKGSHGCFIGLSQRTKGLNSFPIPRSQQREINRDYLNALRRRFGLEDEKWDDIFDC